MSAKQAIKDKLQGSVATYLRCGGVVNNQIKKGLLLSLFKVKFGSEEVSKSLTTLQSYRQKRKQLIAVDCLTCPVHLPVSCLQMHN